MNTYDPRFNGTTRCHCIALNRNPPDSHLNTSFGNLGMDCSLLIIPLFIWNFCPLAWLCLALLHFSVPWNRGAFVNGLRRCWDGGNCGVQEYYCLAFLSIYLFGLFSVSFILQLWWKVSAFLWVIYLVVSLSLSFYIRLFCLHFSFLFYFPLLGV